MNKRIARKILGVSKHRSIIFPMMIYSKRAEKAAQLLKIKIFWLYKCKPALIIPSDQIEGVLGKED